MREGQHGVGSEHFGEPMKIEFLQQQHEGQRTALFPHWTLFIAQALSRHDAEIGREGIFHHDVKQSLLVNIVHELHQPARCSVVGQRGEQGKKFRHIRRGIEAAALENIHRFLFFSFSQQGVQTPPRQTVSAFMDMGILKQGESLFKLF